MKSVTRQKAIEEGSLRLMTLGEISMARKVFGSSINYNIVWIHCDSYFPFGMQSKDYSMAPNGELWFRKESYHSDFSCLTVTMKNKRTFIHELGHVWQHQHGQWVRLRGIFSWAADYIYDLDKEKLTDYSLEQQASIIADYWLLIVYGINQWSISQGPAGIGKYRGKRPLSSIPALYKKIVTGTRS